ncbi:MAG: lysoplasmalogenase [Anaerolineae bacterium]
MSLLLVVLAVVWAALLFGGFFLGRAQPGREGRMPTWTRMASSLTLVAAGWGWAAAASGSPAASFARLIAAGMTLGFLGDLFMARVLPVTPHVLWGMAAFGLGHVAYIAAIIGFGNAHGLNAAAPRWGAWLLWLAIGAGAWYVVVFRGQRPTVLHRAALPYALLLSSTAGFATGLALQHPAFLPLALGAALFLISDLILAARLFAGRSFPLIDDIIWLTYGPGQMLIVYSSAAGLAIG